MVDYGAFASSPEFAAYLKSLAGADLEALDQDDPVVRQAQDLV